MDVDTSSLEMRAPFTIEDPRSGEQCVAQLTANLDDVTIGTTGSGVTIDRFLGITPHLSATPAAFTVTVDVEIKYINLEGVGASTG